MAAYTVKDLQTLQGDQKNIRNICILAHVDHGMLIICGLSANVHMDASSVVLVIIGVSLRPPRHAVVYAPCLFFGVSVTSEHSTGSRKKGTVLFTLYFTLSTA